MGSKFKDVKDEETRKILEEMEEDGEELPELAGATKKPGKNESEEDQDGDDDAHDSNESSGDEEDDADSDETEDQDDEESDEDEDVESEDEDDAPDNSSKSSWKWKKEKQEKKALLEENATLKTRLEAIENLDASDDKKKEMTDKRIEDYAAKHKLNVDEVKELFGIVSEANTSPEVQELIKERREKKAWDKQDDAYEKDFESNVLPVILSKNPKASDKEIQSVHDDLYGKAFDPKYVKKSLVSLYLGSEKTQTRRVTGEDSRGSSFPSVRPKDLDQLTEEDMEDMTDEEFDKYSDALAKKSKSRIVRH